MLEHLRMPSFHAAHIVIFCYSQKNNFADFLCGAGKKYKDFIQLLMAFPYSNICFSSFHIIPINVNVPCCLDTPSQLVFEVTARFQNSIGSSIQSPPPYITSKSIIPSHQKYVPVLYQVLSIPMPHHSCQCLHSLLGNSSLPGLWGVSWIPNQHWFLSPNPSTPSTPSIALIHLVSGVIHSQATSFLSALTFSAWKCFLT